VSWFYLHFFARAETFAAFNPLLQATQIQLCGFEVVAQIDNHYADFAQL